jgi:hypothetical protein
MWSESRLLTYFRMIPRHSVLSVLGDDWLVTLSGVVGNHDATSRVDLGRAELMA